MDLQALPMGQVDGSATNAADAQQVSRQIRRKLLLAALLMTPRPFYIRLQALSMNHGQQYHPAHEDMGGADESKKRARAEDDGMGGEGICEPEDEAQKRARVEGGLAGEGLDPQTLVMHGEVPQAPQQLIPGSVGDGGMQPLMLHGAVPNAGVGPGDASVVGMAPSHDYTMTLDPALMAHIPMAPPTHFQHMVQQNVAMQQQQQQQEQQEDKKPKAGGLKRDGEGQEGEEDYARGADEGQAGQAVGGPPAPNPVAPVQNPPNMRRAGRSKGIRKVRALGP